MIVLHLLSSNKYSGAENVAISIIKKVGNMDKSISFFYASPNGDISKKLNHENVNFLSYNLNKRKTLKKLIRDLKPDIIHAHDIKASINACLCSKKIPIIAHIHNNHKDNSRLSLRSFLMFVFRKRFVRVLWVSRQTFDCFFFKKSFTSKSVVLPNVLCSSELLKKSNEYSISKTYDIIFVGRIAYEKNLERFLEVIKLVCKTLKRLIKVCIIGDGPDLPAIKKLANDYKLNKVVEFKGFLDNPFPYLKSSKLLLMTSKWEGLSMTLLEALFFGVPVISTPVAGAISIIDEKNGFISDSDSEISLKICQILNNELLQKEMSINAKKTFLNVNDEECYFATINNLYNEGADV